MTSPPESFYIFIVGNCEEWPDNRREQGDLALYLEYLDAGVPPEQVLYLRDNECTVTNCQGQLESFLGGIGCNANETAVTLMFYYGGHGMSKGFRTIGGIWPYAQVCETIHSLFEGQRVLFLLDCCDSGNIWEFFPTCDNNNNSSSSKKYVLLANAPPFVLASDEGEEWLVTNSWIRGMRCSVLPTLTTMMEFMADRLALVLGNQAFPFICSTADNTQKWDPSSDRSWMPRRTDLSPSREETLNWARLQFYLPKEARADDGSSCCKAGDSVFYKHIGGSVGKSSLQYIPPMWLAGVVVNADQQQIHLRVHHPAKCLEEWVVVSDTKQLLSGLWMAQEWTLCNSFYKAQVQLAKSWKYLHYSAFPAGVKVKVRDPETGSTSREGAVVDWRLFDWKPYSQAKTSTTPTYTNDGCNDHNSSSEEESLNPSNDTSMSQVECPNFRFGPHIPVKWTDTQQYALVPLQYVVSPDIPLDSFPSSMHDQCFEKTKLLLRSIESSGPSKCIEEIQFWQRKALIRSIETSGKSIVNAKQVFGGNLHSYWPEEDKWYKATPINKDATELPLQVLASHAQFTIRGEYAPLLYEDGERHLSPLYYIRKRRRAVCC